MNEAKQKEEKKDFSEIDVLFQQVSSQLETILATSIRQNDLVIWGGKFAALTADLQTFLEAWNNNAALFEWSLWEFTSRFEVQYRKGASKISPPQNIPDQLVHVERVRLFGEKGDLDIRRDMEHFHWRFIGDPFDPPTTKPDLSAFNPQDYFERNPDDSFRKLEKSYYLWRYYLGHPDEPEVRLNTMWIEELAKAGLPTVDNYLKQYHYFHKGELAFVRYVGIYHAPLQKNAGKI